MPEQRQIFLAWREARNFVKGQGFCVCVCGKDRPVISKELCLGLRPCFPWTPQ